MIKTFSPLMRLSVITAIFLSSIAAAPLSQSEIPVKADTQQLLDDLGGVPCFEGSAFTCVTIEVPLNHFAADTRKIPVVFAVLPASGDRKGMFVTATGGPGTSGVLLADSYSAGFDPTILESFDIVFFDQRGMGLSGGLTCPFAATAYYQRDFRGLTPQQEKALKKSASTFVSDCVTELDSTELLPYLRTKQAVEDLEVFRKLVGDEKFWLYGESYGTQYAQTYAAAHTDHLAGLILDATVDLTLSGFQFYIQQAQAFNDTLVATLSACNEDPACAEQFNGDAIEAYDKLAARLKQGPIFFKYPLANGQFQRNRRFTLSNLEFVAASQLYGESDRMMFLRALAEYTSNSKIVGLARLLYLGLGVDSQTFEVIPDDSWSDAIFYGVECRDYGYPGTTPEERANNYLAAVDPFETSIPRLSSIIYGDLPCAYWPHASSNLTRPGYLVAEGVPTLVLGATADPATPVGHGISVFENLADGYLILTEGGPHVTFGYGNECPDALVTDFLVNDMVPARKTLCEGFVVDAYVPVPPRLAGSLSDPVEGVSTVETEIYYLPEFFYWDTYTPTTVGCTYGGTLEFETNFAGTKYLFDLNRCELTNNFTMTGGGFYNIELDRFVLMVKTTGRWTCDLKYVRTGDQINVTGKCNGKPLNMTGPDNDRDKHQVPDLTAPKHD